MRRDATARVLTEAEGRLVVVPGVGGGPPRVLREPAVSNARLALLALLAAETMLFVGLVGAYVVFRAGSSSWPPPGLPRLPLGVTWANTAVLLASAWTMQRAVAAVRAGDRRGLVRRLGLTAALGAAFLAIQGAEWVRLVHHGLTLSAGTYGATFYTLIGLHGLHVLAAVVWLLAVLGAASAGRFSAARHVAVDVCAMYWSYVVGLWVVLFVIVYLR